MYSLWLVPKGDVRLKLDHLIQYLSHKHSTPTFIPHLTVLGGIRQERQVAIDNARLVAQSQKKVFVKFHDVSHRSGMYFQCVYLLCAKTESIIQLHDKAVATYAIPDENDYMPHVSLMYSDLNAEMRQAIVDEAVQMLYGGSKEGEDTMLSETGFWTNEMELWETNMNNDVANWSLIEKISF